MFIFFLLTISTDCLRTLKDLPIFPSLGLLPSFLSPLTHRSQSLHLLTPYLVQGYVSRRAQWLMNPVLTYPFPCLAQHRFECTVPIFRSCRRVECSFGQALHGKAFQLGSCKSKICKGSGLTLSS